MNRKQVKLFVSEAFGNVCAANDNEKLSGTLRVKQSTELSAGLDVSIVRDVDGRVIDGREAFMMKDVYRFFCLGYTEAGELAQVAWRSFSTAVRSQAAQR